MHEGAAPPAHRRRARRGRRHRLPVPRLRRRAGRGRPPLSDAPAIEARGLGRDHGGRPALHALDLAVPAGALVGLLGPNGAGKTTTMLLLATLLAPTRGRAALFGHDVTRERRRAREALGLVFQEPSVDGLLTVRENLAFALALAGLADGGAGGRIDAALAASGLARFAGQQARTLSGGWRRLLDIVRATLHGPRLLILDEPTVGLDPEHRDAMWHLLDAERRARGTTVLFSTHYLEEAADADRVVLLAAGRVVADGAPAELAAEVGTLVAEVDGPGAARVAEALDAAGATVIARTARGVRLGLRAGGERLAEVATPERGVTRLVVRAPSLDDAYLLHTQAARAEGAA
ncbi:MAG: ABC transporter ATP-binding protein [Gemmatimonadales bacterium]|nr:ABC transporter ATP-binding protein [Gemmatimonadales bacterium]